MRVASVGARVGENSGFAFWFDSALASRKYTLILMHKVVGSIPRNRILSLVIGRWVVGHACCIGWVVWARVGDFAVWLGSPWHHGKAL